MQPLFHICTPNCRVLSPPLLFCKEEHLCKQTINKRSRNRLHPLEANGQRKPLGDIQNVCDSQGAGPEQGSWHAAQPTQSGPSGSQGGVSQRRERHNRMERDRR